MLFTNRSVALREVARVLSSRYEHERRIVTKAGVLRARVVAAPQPAAARVSPADDRAWRLEPHRRDLFCRGWRLADLRVFRARRRAGLPCVPPQLSQCAATRDVAPRRRPVHGRAGRHLWHAPAVAVSAVLAARRARGAARRIEPLAPGVARQQHRHRRLSGPAGAARTRGDDTLVSEPYGPRS